MLRFKEDHFLSASEVQLRIGEIFPKARHFVFSSVNLFVALTQASFLFCAMAFTAWKEFLIGMIGLALTAILVTLSNKAAGLSAQAVPEIQAQLSKGVERSSRNWLFIRISRTQSQEHARLVGHVLDYFRSVVRASEFVNLMLGLPPLFGIILFAFIIFLSRAVFFTNPSDLIIFLYLFLRLVQHLGNAAREWGQCTTYREHFRKALQIFFSLPAQARKEALIPYTIAQASRSVIPFSKYKLETSQFEFNTQQSSAIETAKTALIAPQIQFKNLSFSYPKGGGSVLSNLDLKIPAGSIFGITGPSGSGKSTLLLLTLGMLEPSSGAIEVEGESPKTYFNKNSSKLGYVGAEPFLIEGSIKENLLYGHTSPGSISEAEISKILEQVHLKEVVKNLPGETLYRLDENGSGLSTGQKQRIALARALLRNPQILVLDEASANLDNETEAEIALTLKSLIGKTTVLIVSHRPGLLKPAQVCVHLENGLLTVKT